MKFTILSEQLWKCVGYWDIVFPEAVYQEAVAIEFGLQDIPFVEQPRLNLKFKGHLLKCFYKPDYLCYEEIIVEIKSISKCGPSEKGNSSML